MSISEGDAAALLCELVAIPSVNPALRREGEPDHWFGEAAIGAHVSDWLRRIGLDVEIDTVLPGRPNVIARLNGRPGGRPLSTRSEWMFRKARRSSLPCRACASRSA